MLMAALTGASAVALAALSACAHPARVNARTQSPDPDGCFVIMYQGVEFDGERRLINGPKRIDDLSSLGPEWTQEVGSLRVGDAAIVAVHSREELFGRTLNVAAGTSVPILEYLFPGPVRSMSVQCARR